MKAKELFPERRILAPRIPIDDRTWQQVRDGDITAWALFQRHYSKYHYKDGRNPKRFVGPGDILKYLR